MTLRAGPRLAALLVPVCLVLVAGSPAAPRAAGARQAPAVAGPPAGYDYAREAARAATYDLDAMDPAELRRVFAARRARVLRAMPGGAMLVFSVEQVQPRRLEFQVEHSDNHDFIYLTGVEGLDSYDSALLLLPASGHPAQGDTDNPDRDWVVLYTSSDLDAMRALTGIDDVRPFARLEEDLSVAMTDYRDWRITQIRRWPLPAALARAWGSTGKVLYLNYPRFFRLGMPEPPRLETFARLGRFSPDMTLRDSADVIDAVRMYHDAYSLACLRRAVAITREGLVEGLRAVRAGVAETEIMQIMDFVYRYRGAYLGFPTSVRRQPPGGRPPGRAIPEGFIQFVPRSGADVFEDGDMAHVDTGAAFNHHSADVQRTVPVNGRFTADQRRLYDIALDVQKTVISRIRPGVTWWELHNLAVSMLRDAGGYDQYYTYGIGHLLGMEVHDEGDYSRPLQAGMALTIEQGVAPPDGPRVALEDDVIVTPEGHDWVSRDIPIEPADVEALKAVASSFDLFTKKPPLSIR